LTHATAEDSLVCDAEIRQRPDLEGGVLEGAGDKRQVVVLLVRAAAEEGAGAKGECVRGAAADYLKAEHVVIERGERGRVTGAEADVMDADHESSLLLGSRRIFRFASHRCLSYRSGDLPSVLTAWWGRRPPARASVFGVPRRWSQGIALG
jgi:hypothetical protein